MTYIQERSALSALQTLRKRLLDLTGRNRLINFRHTKGGSLRFINSMPDSIASNIIEHEKELGFQPVPDPKNDELIKTGYISVDEKTKQVSQTKEPSADEWAKQLGYEISYEPHILSTANSEARTLQTLLFPHELESRLRSIRQKSESAIQETGANFLFMSLGFLEWYESTEKRLAPLYLIPVRLEKGKLSYNTGTYEYKLSYTGEEILQNISLSEKLKVDFGHKLDTIDEHVLPDKYFQKVEKLIERNKPNWKVHRYTTLSLLNFSKQLMYRDLDPEKWPNDKPLVSNELVSKFLIGYDSNGEEETAGVPDLNFGEEYELDYVQDVDKNYPIVFDADSSQHSALIDALDGNNLVIEGPPGTGKSQFISNLIASAMAKGKKILFLAEKMAALDVVKNNLDKVGLGEFCFELHSHKSQKKKVLNDLNNRLKNHKAYRAPSEIDVDIKHLDYLKNYLSWYIEKVNQKAGSTGLTNHQILMAATRYRNEIKIDTKEIHVEKWNLDNYTPSKQRFLKSLIDQYINHHRAVTNQLEENTIISKHPWYGVQNTELELFDAEGVIQELKEWQDSLQNLNNSITELSVAIYNHDEQVISSFSDLESFINEVEGIPEIQGDEALEKVDKLSGETLNYVNSKIKLYEKMCATYKELFELYYSDVSKDILESEVYFEYCNKMDELVNKYITAGEIKSGLQIIDSVLYDINSVEEIINNVSDSIDSSASKHFAITVNGVNELRNFIYTAALLKPALYDYRSDVFDNDELDDVIPILKKELENIWELRHLISDKIQVDELPESSALIDFKSVYNESGLFCWLKNSWWTARRSLKSLAKSPAVDFKDILSNLNTVINYKKKVELLESNRKYNEILGDFASGITTDIEKISELRRWYKNVRSAYGIGFGPKVEIGNALINMPKTELRSIHSIYQQGFCEKLERILSKIEEVKHYFNRFSEIMESDISLYQSSSPLIKLKYQLEEAIDKIKPLLEEHNRQWSEVKKYALKLRELNEDKYHWEQADIINLYFNPELSLNLESCYHENNKIDIIYRVLHISYYIDKKISNKIVKNYIYTANDKYDAIAQLRSYSVKLHEANNDHIANRDKYIEKSDLNYESWVAHTDSSIQGLINRNEYAINHEYYLQNWIDYIKVKYELVKQGLANLLDKAERRELPSERIEYAYFASIYDVLARELLKENPKLSNYSGKGIESIRKEFQTYDNKIINLQAKKIAWKIDQNKVAKGKSGVRASELTERSLLDRECEKQKKHIPIRQLLDRASKAIISLKPCFMMSPMSVAQYLEPGGFDFDLIVMDESSQIKPEDALGAIARGTQLVVVGDPKQLPPTRFFDRIDESEEEDPTTIEEAESILEASAPSFPARQLRWHYRSQHESLIYFSNSEFYNGELIIFPSPEHNTDQYGINFHLIKDGCFVNRKNLKEARAVTKAVEKHLANNPDESIGVVAMNSEQREQIEASIEQLEKDNSDFQKISAQNSQKDEPLFVKNLENVQGDERDVIIISMTYGPNEPRGRIAQRFGPINSEVGWRRLNVLFTRAKKRMEVFSSMQANHIMIGNNSKRGVKALKDFLNYCQSGILHSTNYQSEKEPENEFEVAVARKLNSEGFECAFQVGVAGFFIDIAVKDPGSPGQYLVGVECDGATYHSAKSARDRDRLRQEVLEKLGWRIRRIWSTDWFKNPEAVIKPLVKELHKIKTDAPVTEKTDKTVTEEISKNDGQSLDSTLQIEKENEGNESFENQKLNLKEKLEKFDREVIQVEFPDIPEEARLLNPSMISSFIKHRPTSKAEFLSKIPAHLRNSMDAKQGRYLEEVFDIINSVEVTEEYR